MNVNTPIQARPYESGIRCTDLIRKREYKLAWALDRYAEGNWTKPSNTNPRYMNDPEITWLSSTPTIKTMVGVIKARHFL